MTFYESNREIGETGAEAGEYADDGPLSRPDEGDVGDQDVDPEARPTGALPLRDGADDEQPGHEAQEAGE